MLGTTDPSVAKTTDGSGTSSRHSAITSSKCRPLLAGADLGRTDQSGRSQTSTFAACLGASASRRGLLALAAADHSPQRLDARAQPALPLEAGPGRDLQSGVDLVVERVTLGRQLCE